MVKDQSTYAANSRLNKSNKLTFVKINKLLVHMKINKLLPNIAG